jgi:hypothetical protein
MFTVQMQKQDYHILQCGKICQRNSSNFVDYLINYYINEEKIVIREEKELDMDKVLNLDAFIIL